MDYSITEMLTRTIAFERMKHLSEAFAEARSRGDVGMMHAVARERQELRDTFIKVVK